MEEGLWVDTTPTKEAVVSSLTRDTRPEECLYDLIDNSIDAARQNMLAQGNVTFDEYGLPANYDGYWVELDISGKAIKVTDNCGGTDLQQFRDVTFRFGQRSDQSFGIGTFGVGLNRALFRLGTASRIVSDDGKNLKTVSIDHKSYLSDPKWLIPGTTETSTNLGVRGTTIEIFDPPAKLAREFARPKWIEQLKNDASKRYFRLLQKGFEIIINESPLRPNHPPLRENGPYEIQKIQLTELNGVRVFLESGEHANHRLSTEKDFSHKTARTLPPDYGWTIMCNDRAIIVADKSARTGWDATWHGEYNGFVGYVWFVSEQPDQLPWNTKKSDVDVSNEVYAVALESMRDFASQWRGFTRKTRHPQSSILPPSPGSIDTQPPKNIKGGKNTSEKKEKSKLNKLSPQDHVQCRTVLPDDIEEVYCRDKMLRLVREAKTLVLDDYIYSGLLTLRTLFELSAIQYLALTKKLVEFKRECLSEINENRVAKGRSRLSIAEEHNFSPSFEDICNYFLNHPEAWGLEDFNYLKHALDDLKKNRQILNGVAHNPSRPVSLNQAINIRDATVPLLRHLLTRIPSKAS